MELHAEFLGIRNKTIAHRDADAMHQYRLIRNLNEQKIVSRAGDYFTAAEPLMADLIELTHQIGDMGHILNQYVGKKIV